MTTGDPLRDALAALRRGVPPRRDLWPDIRAQLAARQPQHRAAAPAQFEQTHPENVRGTARRKRPARRALWAAGSLAAAAAAVVLALGMQGTPAGGDTDTLARDSLADSYAAVRADIQVVLDNQCDGLAASACNELQAGLQELDRSIAELRQALVQAEDGSSASQWLATRLRRAVCQTRGLAGQAIRIL
ncbi:MAG: hypothetical protein RBT60_07500 [Candidatus Krumholzibacteria bacterium]|jgi:hypothetical protein|nr:hypothetical protein [Candidatus Krumholzibacteria bacterium]